MQDLSKTDTEFNVLSADLDNEMQRHQKTRDVLQEMQEIIRKQNDDKSTKDNKIEVCEQ